MRPNTTKPSPPAKSVSPGPSIRIEDTNTKDTNLQADQSPDDIYTQPQGRESLDDIYAECITTINTGQIHPALNFGSLKAPVNAAITTMSSLTSHLRYPYTGFESVIAAAEEPSQNLDYHFEKLSIPTLPNAESSLAKLPNAEHPPNPPQVLPLIPSPHPFPHFQIPYPHERFFPFPDSKPHSLKNHKKFSPSVPPSLNSRTNSRQELKHTSWETMSPEELKTLINKAVNAAFHAQSEGGDNDKITHVRAAAQRADLASKKTAIDNEMKAIADET